MTTLMNGERLGHETLEILILSCYIVQEKIYLLVTLKCRSVYMGDLFSLYLRGTYVEEKVQVHTNPVSSAYVN